LLKNKNKKSITPKSNRWEDEQSSSIPMTSRDRFGGIEDLQRRLECLRINRLEMQGRDKIKS
jgi:hypothetical protein